jgi:hypothetical protein
MPNLYIDHSVITHPPSWKPLKDVLAAGKVQLALSLWNLFEIGSASDKTQQAQRLAFLEQFSPLWILERLEIQRQEVQRFLWKMKFCVASEAMQVFKRHLSEVESYYAGSETRIGLTPTQWINGVNFARYDAYKDRAPTALRQIQIQGAKKIAERQDEIFGRWIDGLLPKINPEGHAFTKDELSAFLTLCQVNQAEFYAACPAMAVEDALTRARTAAPARTPKRSDGIDLMHAVVALAYSDFFLVRDGFVFHCCETVRRELSEKTLATVYRDAEELRKALA